ncbi:MAG: inorganic phosphate transporter [Deltaproteobacteria bacterium]|nr:inorganic phosphate transporter [Deltaproteobacteria bacterium]
MNPAYFVIFIIFIALVFDFINGFHDAANSIATVVSTRVLRPHQAVLMAAFCNFAAAFFIEPHVAKTMGTGIINPIIVDNYFILSALGGAIIWNLITWWLCLPSSSSHALIGGLIGAGFVKGGLIGAGFVKGGLEVMVWKGIIKTTIFIFLAPAIGLVLGLFIMIVVLNLFRHSNISKTTGIFKKLQIVSAATYSVSHGMNDAQKTMGIIAILLFNNGFLGTEFYVPFWVEILCYLILAMGTMAGGWRIVKTMGMRITKLQPIGGFCAETAAAISIIGASIGGIPVSTTHTITGAIMGVGSTKRLTAVHWGIAGKIVWAWILTIPIAAVLSAIIYVFLQVIMIQ